MQRNQSKEIKKIPWQWGAEVKNKGTEGFNDAGILTFNSHAINSLVREQFQNSNDAKAKGENKVVIRIDYCCIPKEDIPGLEQFIELLGLVEKENQNQKKFFKKATDSLTERGIPFLVYSDSKTTGLKGKEEDNDSSFVACVLSEGKSAKESGNAGGSFGIGKNAIYGISNLRTVFYSSLNTEGDYIFQGVAKLASYKKDGQNHEGRIYLGTGEHMLAIREKDSIPTVFSRNEPGLSQYVMGVNLESSWSYDFTKAILRNYWMLLLNNGLEVELLVNGRIIQKISSENVVDLIKDLFKNDEEEYSLKPYGNPYLFYDAFMNGDKREFEIPHLGRCSFYYKESEKGENNIAYLRNGMVVYSDIEKRLVGANVTGVFICEPKEGNEILRLMEPPKHDSFEPQMLEDKHELLSKKDGEKILANIKVRIRSVIKELIEKYKVQTETPAFLTELFEDLQKNFNTSSKGERKNEKSDIETIHRRAKDDKIEIRLYSDQENSYVNSLISEKEDGGAGNGQGINPLRKETSGTKSGRGKKGGVSKGIPNPKHRIQSRIFFNREENGRNIYKALLTSNISIINTEATLYQYGDSGEEIAFILHKVYKLDGSSINFDVVNDSDGLVSEYRLKNLDISSEGSILFLEISDNQKSAFIIKG